MTRVVGSWLDSPHRRYGLLAFVVLAAIGFIAASVHLLCGIEDESKLLTMNFESANTLRAIESHAFGLRDSTSPDADEQLLRELNRFAQSADLPSEARGLIEDARTGVMAMRELRTGTGSRSISREERLDRLISISHSIARARNSLQYSFGNSTAHLNDLWRILTALVVASCFLAVIVVVLLFFQLAQIDRRRALESELESAFEHAPVGILLCDESGSIRRVNRALCDLLRSTPAALVGRSVGGLCVEEADDLPAALSAMIAEGRETMSFESELRRDDGKSITTICHVRVTRTLRGSGRVFALHLDDVTERRRAIESLAERTDSLNALLSASRDGLILIGPDGRIAYANRSLREILGIDVDLFPGMSGADLEARIGEWSPESAKTFARLFGGEGDDLRQSLLPFRATLPIPFAKIVLISAVPVHGADGRWIGRLCVVRDVTQEERARRAKDAFLGNVSHELRTPLTSISGFVELMRNERIGPLSDKQKHTLRIVSENVNRLAALVSDLLAVGEFEEERPVFGRVDLAELLRGVIELERATAEQKSLGLMLDVPAEIIIEGDEKRLRHLFSNLVSNAVKYTLEGEVTATARVLDENCVEVTITDTGIGIDPVDKIRIFERFFRAENAETRAIRGTGLGLAIVKLAIEQHGGRIEVESKRGSGSTFRVLLPRRRGAPIPEPLPAPAPTPRERPLVLAIDDDRLAHRIIAASLERCGIDVICAETGEQGVRIANEHHPEVMLVDLELPDFNGLEVIASVRANGSGSPPSVIVISGQDRPQSLELHGVTSFLPKPVRSEVLREEVMRVLAMKGTFGPDGYARAGMDG